eukprot:8268315-Pyramimonas_sp.AAC.1
MSPQRETLITVVAKPHSATTPRHANPGPSTLPCTATQRAERGAGRRGPKQAVQRVSVHPITRRRNITLDPTEFVFTTL